MTIEFVYEKVDLEYLIFLIKTEFVHAEITCIIKKQMMTLRLKRPIFIHEIHTPLIHLYFDTMDHLKSAIHLLYE